jgi:iron-sulfur cluster assembly protein
MIHLSSAAVRELNRIKSKQAQSEVWLRLVVAPGGCASLCYDMAIAAEPQPDDLQVECDSWSVAIASNSTQYLDGMTIDYAEDLMGGGFRFDNPNAEQTCSCGNSFKAIAR